MGAPKLKSGTCPTCGRVCAFEKPRVNNLIHFILTLCTLGLWGLVWIAAKAWNVTAQSYRCRSCGTTFSHVAQVKAAVESWV